ncbi:hypothetical protein M9H77_29976 [Catharanthus roseus]|uniref:Uncharacterized protein n=1 Tax=Catharanthus roseus TaxID=4058 RepID=A0ACB9ZWR4_CATRO|nr:hypothetical protein M9H77_29976 [Catharanthus roseus]
MVMLRLHDLRRSSCNRLSSSERVLCRFKIYNIVAKIKKNQMQGRNTIEEVLCLRGQRGYTIFYKNHEESNVLSDIVVAHQTSIAMIRTWPYVLIMDTTYNMPLLEAVEMTLTGKDFTVTTTFMCNEQATTYRWVLQQIKHLYVTYAMSNGHGSIFNEGEPLGLDISSVAFGVETTNCAESETIAINFAAESNATLKNISNKISLLALKKIWLEIKKARRMVEDPESKCLHYLRKSHGLPCACERSKVLKLEEEASSFSIFLLILVIEIPLVSLLFDSHL